MRPDFLPPDKSPGKILSSLGKFYSNPPTKKKLIKNNKTFSKKFINFIYFLYRVSEISEIIQTRGNLIKIS